MPNPNDLVKDSKTPKSTVLSLRERGYQPEGIQKQLPHLSLKAIEAVLKEFGK